MGEVQGGGEGGSWGALLILLVSNSAYTVGDST